MKILIISKAFHPQNNPRSFRTTELATELVRQGHEVTVAVPVESADTREFCRKHSITLIDLGKSQWRELEIKGPKPFRFIRRAIRRGAITLFEYPDLEIAYQIKRALKDCEYFDLAITIAAPHAVHWGFCSLFKKNKNLCQTWIADCGDPFMGVKIDTFRKPFYFKFLEKSFCKKADFITVPVPGAFEGYYPEFHSKIHVIPQGFKFPEPGFWPPYVPNPVPTFAFAGGFIPGVRDPRPILNWLATKSRPFKFVFYTQQSDLIQTYVEQLGPKTEIRAYLPRQQLLFELAKMDFLVNIENRTSMMSPSKLIDYALTRRPILSLDSYNLNHGNFEQFLAGDYSHQLQFTNLEDYRIENVARRFIELASLKMETSASSLKIGAEKGRPEIA